MDESIRISIIVPVYNHAEELRECLTALQSSAPPESEILVVDDASSAQIFSVVAAMGAKVFRLEKNSGPAMARNYGARHATGEILFFVDADVVVAPEAVEHVIRTLGQNSDIAAVFGSYDAFPRASGVVSRYRNLLHHYVHQNGNPDASTFWAGCGAVRRKVFEEMSGFDENLFPRASIEDIELGYRLRQAGHRILLDKSLLGTHLKRWTLRSLIRTDILCRALPWARLLLESRQIPADLNLKFGQRVSAGLVMLACVLVVLGVFRSDLLALAGVALVAVIVINRSLYGFFFNKGGFGFTAACILLHFLFYLYSGLSYLYVWASFRLGGARPGKANTIRETGEQLER